MNEDRLDILIKGCKQNDRRSQNELYEMYNGFVFHIALKHTNDPLIAEEIRNDIFLNIFTKIGSYNYQGPFKAWLSILSMNTSINYVRKKQNVIYDSNKILIEIDQMYDQKIIEQIDSKDFNQIQEIILKPLPPSTKRIFKLRLMDFKNKEIADMFGVNEGTVKWHMNEARKKLSFLCQDKNHIFN
jgi:RNA polymerase sigma-70 factor (ECF subfamily)